MWVKDVYLTDSFGKKAGKPPQIYNNLKGLAVNEYLTQQPER